MTTQTEALKLALEALEGWGKGFPDNWGDLDTEAVTAIKEALAQPEQFKPLTDDEAFELIEQDYQMEEYAQAALQLIRRTEAAHGIKGEE